MNRFKRMRFHRHVTKPDSRIVKTAQDKPFLCLTEDMFAILCLRRKVCDPDEEDCRLITISNESIFKYEIHPSYVSQLRHRYNKQHPEELLARNISSNLGDRKLYSNRKQDEKPLTRFQKNIIRPHKGQHIDIVMDWRRRIVCKRECRRLNPPVEAKNIDAISTKIVTLRCMLSKKMTWTCRIRPKTAI